MLKWPMHTNFVIWQTMFQRTETSLMANVVHLDTLEDNKPARRLMPIPFLSGIAERE
jgi:hypothetical protein